MAHLLNEFEACLRHFELAELDGLENVVYGVDADWGLAYLNAAWQKFARDNRGEPGISRDWGLGRSMLEAIPEALQLFYRDGYQTCRRSGKPWHHEFECSGPETYRRYQQTTYPLTAGKGLLIVNALVCEHPHPLPEESPDPQTTAAYADSDAIVHQCCHCRRISHPRVAGRWDWVPALVAKPSPRTSHTLCAVCLDFYYPEDGAVTSHPPQGDGQ